MKELVYSYKEIKIAKLKCLQLMLVLFLGVSCTCKAQHTIPLKEDKSLELVSIQFEKWKNNEASFFDILADDVVWTVSGNSPVSGTYNNKIDFLEQAVKPILAKLKTPLKPELISLSTDGEFVWSHFTARAKDIFNGDYENNYIWKMQLKNHKVTNCIAFLDTYALTKLMTNKETNMDKTIEETKEYIGIWITADGHIRHELLPNNRYDEARGNRESAYQGRYVVRGNHIEYKDDTGFIADGDFKDGILYHGGMIFYKEKKN